MNQIVPQIQRMWNFLKLKVNRIFALLAKVIIKLGQFKYLYNAHLRFQDLRLVIFVWSFKILTSFWSSWVCICKGLGSKSQKYSPQRQDFPVQAWFSRTHPGLENLCEFDVHIPLSTSAQTQYRVCVMYLYSYVYLNLYLYSYTFHLSTNSTLRVMYSLSKLISTTSVTTKPITTWDIFLEPKSRIRDQESRIKDQGTELRIRIKLADLSSPTWS